MTFSWRCGIQKIQFKILKFRKFKMQELSSLVGCEVPEKTIGVGASPKRIYLKQTVVSKKSIWKLLTLQKNYFLVFGTCLKIYFEK